MENHIQTEKVMLKKEKLSVSIEQIVENDVSLPDYFGDIVKILGSETQTDIFSAGITGDKAVIDGRVTVRTLYIDGNSKTEIFECVYPFNRSVDVKDADENDTVSVTADSAQITCRAVSQRRADIRGSVTLKIAVTGIAECNIITDADENFCHTLKASAEGSFLLGSASKAYTLTASEELSESSKQGKIFRAVPQTTVNEVKTIKNKMMIKGSVSADIILLTAEGNFSSERINMPFNQICDMENIDEETACCVKLTVRSLDLRITPDEARSAPSVEASAIVAAEIDAYKKAEITMVTEAYSSACELICADNKVRCVKEMRRINENYAVTSKMDFSSCKAKSIVDASVKKIRYAVSRDGQNLVCKGNLHFGIVVDAAEGERLYFERIADFEYTRQIGAETGECEFTPAITVNAVSCSVDSDSKAAVTAELRIDGFAYNTVCSDAVTFIEKGKEHPRNNDDCVITVYYASAGEKLWDIAKSHGTSVKKITEANSIGEDALKQDCMLVFELE